MYLTIEYWVKVFISKWKEHRKETGHGLIYLEMLHRKDIPCELCELEDQKFFDERLGETLETKKHPFENDLVIHFFDA